MAILRSPKTLRTGLPGIAKMVEGTAQFVLGEAKQSPAEHHSKWGPGRIRRKNSSHRNRANSHSEPLGGVMSLKTSWEPTCNWKPASQTLRNQKASHTEAATEDACHYGLDPNSDQEKAVWPNGLANEAINPVKPR